MSAIQQSACILAREFPSGDAGAAMLWRGHVRSGPCAEQLSLLTCKPRADTSPGRGERALWSSRRELPGHPNGSAWDWPGLGTQPDAAAAATTGWDVSRSSRTFVSLRRTQHHLCPNGCAFGINLIGFHVAFPNKYLLATEVGSCGYRTQRLIPISWPWLGKCLGKTSAASALPPQTSFHRSDG